MFKWKTFYRGWLGRPYRLETGFPGEGWRRFKEIEWKLNRNPTEPTPKNLYP